MGKVVPVSAGPGPGPNFFFWPGPGWDRHQNLFLKGPGPRPKNFSRRNRDEIFFLTGTGTGTGTKNDWSRSCLIVSHIPEFRNAHPTHSRLPQEIWSHLQIAGYVTLLTKVYLIELTTCGWHNWIIIPPEPIWWHV
jgi:hypothetical protein